MKKLGLIFLILFYISGIDKANASHVLGTELTWSCVGQDSFLIKLVVYRDCNGITLSTSPITFRCADSTAAFTSLNIVVGTPVDITPVCKSTCTRCQSASCSFPYGIHKFTMMGIVNLSKGGSCCNINLAWEQCCRNSAISTGAGGANFYSEAKLNRCQNPCDNSPSFTNLPVAIICVGQNFTFNNGIYDADLNKSGGLADSLTYEWAEPLQAANSVIPYTSPYAYNKAINFYGFPNDTLPFPKGIHLDAHNGDIRFRPMKAEVTIMVVRVNEFRNGVKIAEIRRDMQIIVITCFNNKPPYIITPNDVRSMTVNAGKPVTFNFSTNDSNINDSVKITWNNAIPGAIWTNTNGLSKHPAASLTWTPTAANGGTLPYTFTVTAKDNICPVSAQFTQAYQIFVKPIPVIKINPIEGCINGPIISLNNYVTVNGKSTSKGIWSSPSAGLIYGDKFNPIAAGLSTTPGWKVVFEYTDSATGLYNKDSGYVTIHASPKPFAGIDDSICSGSSIPLAGTPILPPGTWRGTGVGGSYPNWWFNPDTTGIMNGGTYEAIYHYKDANQCENEDTMKITVFKTPVVEAGNPMDFCIDAGAVTLTGTPAGGIWKGKGVTGGQFSPTIAASGVHDLTYTYKNVFCVATDNVKYSVWDLPFVTANTVSGQLYFCRNFGLVQLNGQPGGTGGVWSGPGVSGATFNTYIGADTIAEYSLRYSYSDIHKCSNKADLKVKVKPEPVVVIDPSGNKLCFGNPFTINAQYNHADGVFWRKGVQSDGTINGNPTSTMISYIPGLNDQARLYFWLYIKTTHTDSICAPAYDSIKVNLRAKPPTPVISLAPSDSFLEGNIAKGSYNWFYRPDTISAPTVITNLRRINPQLYCNKCYFSTIYLDSIGCASDTSAPYLYIGNSVEQNIHHLQFLIYPNPAHTQLFIENPDHESAYAILSDIYGRKLTEQKVMPGKSTLNISSLKPGIYILKLDDSYIYRLVVE